jgi:hypothetical protein
LSLFQRLGERQTKPNILFECFAGVLHLNGFSDPRFSRFYLPPDPGNRWVGLKRQDVWHVIQYESSQHQSFGTYWQGQNNLLVNNIGTASKLLQLEAIDEAAAHPA